MQEAGFFVRGIVSSVMPLKTFITKFEALFGNCY